MLGTEPEEFWSSLGGSSDYFKVDKKFSQQNNPKIIKMFVNLKENFLPANKISTKYLTESSIAILDTFDQLYLWCGSECTEGSKKLAQMFAEEYLQKIKDGRTNKTVSHLEDSKEPYDFTKHFHSWNYPIEEKPLTEMEKVVAQYKTSFTFEELQNKSDLPPHVDLQKLEDYLQEDDFPNAFGLTKEQFFKLPGWKRTALKKKIDLF